MLNDIIRNQKKVLKAIKSLNKKYSRLESYQDSLSKKLHGNEFDLLKMGSEQINKIDEFYDKAITRYNMHNISDENLKKQCIMKNRIKNEMRFHHKILECVKKLEGNLRVIEKFLIALKSYEENKEVFTSSYIQKEMTQNYLTLPTLADDDFPEALYGLLQSGKFDDGPYHFSVYPITFNSLQSTLLNVIYYSIFSCDFLKMKE